MPELADTTKEVVMDLVTVICKLKDEGWTDSMISFEIERHLELRLSEHGKG
jgi:hypothetical protein